MAESPLLAHLAKLGATEAQLADLDDGQLIGLAGDLQLSAGLSLTLDDVAREAGCDPDEVRAIYEGLGLRVEDLAGFGEGDVALISLIASDTSGIIDTVGPQLLRVAGSALSRLAEAAVAAYVQDVEHHDDERDLIAEAAAAMAFGDELCDVQAEPEVPVAAILAHGHHRVEQLRSHALR